MNRRYDRTLVFSFLGAALVCTSPNVAAAESLRADVAKATFLLYEPIAVHVTLNLDEPIVVNWEDPHEAQRQLGRLPRRLRIELRDQDEAKVSETVLIGTEFMRLEESSKEFPTSGLAFFRMPKNRGDVTPALEPGDYTIVVLDYSNRKLKSNTIAVELVAAQGRDLLAEELFRLSLPDGIVVINGQEVDAAVMNCVEELARDYGETVYGRYAVVGLALIRFQETFAEHNIRGGAAVWEPVARELAAAEKLFTGKHPLREKALFDLARAHAISRDYARTRQTLAALKKDFPRGKLGSKSAQFEEEISQLEKQNRPNGEQP